MPTLAPIALFVYRRAEHARRTLEALLRNPEAERSKIYVFADGPKSGLDAPDVARTREVVSSFEVDNIVVVRRESNAGLARSIVEGVTQLCREHGQVIVLEDDIVVAPDFLAYMNSALDRYRDDDRVMQISGHMFPVEIRSRHDAVFLPFITSWGWGTWDRAWKHFDPSMAGAEELARDRRLRMRFDLGGAYPYFRILEKQRRGEIDSWAIRWYLSVFRRSGLALYPVASRVRNIGLDGSGTHGRGGRSNESQQFGALAPLAGWPPAEVDLDALRHVARYLRREQWVVNKVLGRAKHLLRRAIRTSERGDLA